MISRVCYCFRLSRVSYSLYCNKLSVHNNSHASKLFGYLYLHLLLLFLQDPHPERLPYAR